jgi:uncharacterized protein (TIGR03437 family)
MRHPFSLLGVFLATAGAVHAQQNQVVISQIYGGGGNAGAPLRSDFIELFNRGSVSVNVVGWTVQYASSSGSSWDRTELSGVIQPGRYLLVAEHTGDTGTLIPTAEVSGSINLSATAGKVALVLSDTPLTGSSPTTAAIVDFVGYGSANASEGSPAPALSNSLAAQRKGSGCTDTNRNSDDLSTGFPQPRNGQTALVSCGSSPAGPVIASGGITNAANYSGGAVSPGELVTLFGSNLGPTQIQTLQLTPDRSAVVTSLGGTRVLFGGVASPLIYVLDSQVSAVVPYSVSSRASVDIQVEFNGRLSAAVRVPVVGARPGIFTINSSGTGQGAIQNQDYTINGLFRPASLGSIVTIYGTGGGATEPQASDGAVVGLPLPRLREAVFVRIGGLNADVLYAGMAPGLVNGVFQINARIPVGLAMSGAVPMEVQVGGSVSQTLVTVVVQGPGGDAAGTGPLIEQRLQELRTVAFVPPIPEIPHDRIGVPSDWLGLLSWNIQVGGTAVTPSALRPPMVRDALARIFGGTFQILAAQEIPNRDSATLLTSMLPGGTLNWHSSFIDSSDSMDNGYWFRNGVVLRDAFLLGVRDGSNSGAVETDPQIAVHPPQVGQFEIGDFDFTLINLHLTFADGNTAESARELSAVLDYLDWYFRQPEHDPDVIVCGDYNIPSRLSGQQGRGGLTLDGVLQSDPRFAEGERRFAVLVHEPTSRSSQANGGGPASNYDHCAVSADTLEEFIAARRVEPSLLTEHPDDPELRLTSDHFPIVAFFRQYGALVSLDRRLALRRDGRI